MRDTRFERDDTKAARNRAKHGVGFEAARAVFEDFHVVEQTDDRRDYGEPRYVAIGMVDGRLISVVYTMRSEHIRIISVRLAERRERRLYHEGSL
jgi:uncharacterized DUF497 family protein